MSFHSVPHVLIKFCSSEDWMLIGWNRWIEEEKYTDTRREAPFPKHTLAHMHTHTHTKPTSSPFRCQPQIWKMVACTVHGRMLGHGYKLLDFWLKKKTGRWTIKKAVLDNDAAMFKSDVKKTKSDSSNNDRFTLHTNTLELHGEVFVCSFWLVIYWEKIKTKHEK